MDMVIAIEVKKILNEIDDYKSKMADLRTCVNLNGTITDGHNGRPFKYSRSSLEVCAIITAYECRIAELEQKISNL